MASYSRLTKQLNDEEKAREAEINARRSKLCDSYRWINTELDAAQRKVDALKSARSSLDEEDSRLHQEYLKLHDWE